MYEKIGSEYAYIEMITGGMLTIILDINDNNPKELMCNHEIFVSAKTLEELGKIFATSFERCCISYKRDENGRSHYSDIWLIPAFMVQIIMRRISGRMQCIIIARMV